MTIRLRLTIYWAAVLAAILLVAAIAVVKLFERQQFSALDAALLEEAQNTANQIEPAARRARPESCSGSASRPILGRGGECKSSLRMAKSETSATSTRSRRRLIRGCPRIRDRRRSRVQIRGRADDVRRRAGVPAKRHAGGPGRGIDRQPAQPAAVMVPILLLLCVGGGYLLAGRAAAADRIGDGGARRDWADQLSSRLTVPPRRDDEIARLTDGNQLAARAARTRVGDRARFASDARMNCGRRWPFCARGWRWRSRANARPSENRAALGAAHREALSLCRIADELLMLSRLNGETMVDRHKLNLRALLSEIAATVGPLAQAREIKLKVDAWRTCSSTATRGICGASSSTCSTTR